MCPGLRLAASESHASNHFGRLSPPQVPYRSILRHYYSDPRQYDTVVRALLS